jgi:hypothetical protein
MARTRMPDVERWAVDRPMRHIEELFKWQGLDGIANCIATASRRSGACGRGRGPERETVDDASAGGVREWVGHGAAADAVRQRPDTEPANVPRILRLVRDSVEFALRSVPCMAWVHSQTSSLTCRAYATPQRTLFRPAANKCRMADPSAHARPRWRSVGAGAPIRLGLTFVTPS